MSWRVWLLMLAALAVFAAAWRRCSHRMLVGDFPLVERSSRGLALATLPHVAALVAPSARVHTRASRGTRQGQSRALRQSRGWAWCPAPRCPQRYGSTQQRWQVPAPTARALVEPPAIEQQPPASAVCQCAESARPRGHNPGTRETARARRLFARQYRGGGHARECIRRETPCLRGSNPPPWRVAQSLGLPRFGLASSDERHRSREDFDDHGPHHRLSRRYLARQLRSFSIAIIPKCCQHGEHEVTTRNG